MRPQRRTTRSAASDTALASATSSETTNASPPSAFRSSLVAASASASRANTPTRQPRRANSLAMARPRPAVPPVMTTTLDRGAVMAAPLLSPGQGTDDEILEPLAEVGRQRPGTGLPDDMQATALLQDLVVAAAVALPEKTQA